MAFLCFNNSGLEFKKVYIYWYIKGLILDNNFEILYVFVQNNRRVMTNHNKNLY